MENNSFYDIDSQKLQISKDLLCDFLTDYFIKNDILIDPHIFFNLMNRYYNKVIRDYFGDINGIYYRRRENI